MEIHKILTKKQLLSEGWTFVLVDGIIHADLYKDRQFIAHSQAKTLRTLRYRLTIAHYLINQ